MLLALLSNELCVLKKSLAVDAGNVGEANGFITKFKSVVLDG